MENAIFALKGVANMNSSIRCVVSAALLLVISQSTLAIQPGGLSAASSSSVSTTSVVERGGTINTVDSKKRTLVVDGVAYELLSNAKLNPLPGNATQKAVQLKAGMKIRFSTVKNYSSGQNEVREVWVASDEGN